MAYRIFGELGAAPPLLLVQRFRGTMDHWDPVLLDRLAQHRLVIVFDNRGVARSGGLPARSIAEQAQGAIDLIDALRIDVVDVLGWSMGGAVTQIMALDHPNRVRKIVVAGSGPGGVIDVPAVPGKVWQVASKPVNDDEDFLYLFFHDSPSSEKAGRQHLQRLQSRHEPFSPPVAPETVMAQLGAIRAWSAGTGSARSRLGELRQPALVANGQRDRMVHPYNSYVMSQDMPNAKLVLYPDSGHAFHFQHVESFSEEVDRFLA
jgi:pimeloyl-ACP methyl ester carboxylesterase